MKKRRAGPRRRRRWSRPPIGRERKDVDALRSDLGRRVNVAATRWNAGAEDVQRSVVKLVLTLVEFLHQLFERQALRRMEANTLTPEQMEAIGLALMRLEETIHDLAERFDLTSADLNFELGPLGRLT